MGSVYGLILKRGKKVRYQVTKFARRALNKEPLLGKTCSYLPRLPDSTIDLQTNINISARLVKKVEAILGMGGRVSILTKETYDRAAREVQPQSTTLE